MDNNTMKFNAIGEGENHVREVLRVVYEALQVKGYNPINQIVGFIMSGDPTYITSHNNARNLIGRLERDEIIEEIVTEYLKNL
ncbi:MAG: IreB family regulatory phosphoprotein [Clostridia bacterium]|nr:IreB family regulatory phosphoprotein [Clostridia bacterium]